jgi:flagellar hook-associated protein 3 FlgL
VVYSGSSVEQLLQVDASHKVAIGKNGNTLFPTNSDGKSLFAVVSDAVTKLKDPTLTAQDKKTQLQKLGQALTTTRDALSTQQTKIGVEMSELDHLDEVGSAYTLQHAQTLASLQDLDYSAALSNLSRQQLVLQASQKAFSQISNLSLFDYIG